MNDTYYQWHDALPSNVAQGYFDLYNNNTLINVSNLVTGSGNGYGGVFSNLFDLHRFAEALLIHRTLLQPASMDRMMSFGKTDGNNRYGCGIQKCFLELGNDYGLGHKGRDLGYTANLFYFPSKGVLHIFFINYGTGPESELRQVFYDFQDELLRISLQ
jgi:D-alanyl-D-alanine carboxypeptidase